MTSRSFQYGWLFLFLIFTSHTISRAQTNVASKVQPVISKFDRNNYLIRYKKFVLDNGLTLLVHTDHSVPVVAVNLWYHVGSRNELPGKTGFAHLFEHFFFNGSENYPHGFREAMDDVGANNRNGTTNNDRTNFFEDVPVSALERTLYLEADRMGFLTTSKEMLERERGVVQNEKRQGENRPYAKLYNEIPVKMYPKGHPYSWRVIGSMEDLNAASLDDIRNWYKNYYGPNNAVISLAGDITPEKAQELVKKYFDAIPPVAPLTRATSWMPSLDHNIRDEIQDRVPQVLISRVYHVPAWKEKELSYIRLLTNILSGSNSARLDKKLIYEKKIATAVNVNLDGQELGSLLFVEVLVSQGADPVVVEREMDAVLNDFIKTGPTMDEMNRAKSRNRASFSRNIERLGGFGGRSDVLAESMTYGGSPEAYLDNLETMEKALPQDVLKTAQKWLQQYHYTGIVKPYPDLKAVKNDLDRSVLPGLSKAPEITFPQLQQATLKNGLKVMLLERKTVPIVNVTMAIDAGISSDPLAVAGISSLATDLLKKGTKTRDAFKISDELDLLGASISATNSLDLSYVRLEALSDNLQPSLKIFADVVLNPSFPQDQFAIQKKQYLEQIEQEKVEPNDVAFRILPALLYGENHPYGMPVSGSGFEKTINSVTRNDLVEWHSNWFKPGSSTIIVAGNVSMDKLLPYLENAFGNWKPGKAPQKNVSAVAKTPGKKVYLIDKPDATQSTIVAAHVSMPGGQDDEIAIETVLRNFGGMSTSRLNRNLRLDKHWSYGSQGTIRSARGQRPFIIIAPVQTDKTKESMMEVNKEILGVAGERPLAGEEYSSIMRNMTLRLPARFATLNALEDAAIRILNYNLAPDYWSSYSTKVSALTETQLNEAAKRYIHPDEVIWLVVGDLNKVEKGIRELNFGEVIRLNADGEVIK